MNTFISLWKEETNQTFETVIEKSKLVLQLIEKMKLMLLETPSYNLRDKDIIQYEGSILQLQELLHLKFNIATEILLRQASTLADLDTGNMEKTIQDENVTLYVWANLKKNPRYRSVRFSNTKTGFEIPKILATSDIALRLLHTHFDHVTPLHAVPAPPVQRVPAGTELFKGEAKSAPEALNREDPEDAKPQGRGSVFIQEGEIHGDEQGDAEVQMADVRSRPSYQKPAREVGVQEFGNCSAHVSCLSYQRWAVSPGVAMVAAMRHGGGSRGGGVQEHLPITASTCRSTCPSLRPHLLAVLRYLLKVIADISTLSLLGNDEILSQSQATGRLQVTHLTVLQTCEDFANLQQLGFPVDVTLMAAVKKDSKATEGELEMKLLSESVAEAQLDLIRNAPEKPEFSENKEVDLCQFMILGGVYHLDILELPPQCKPVKGWIMVEILKEGLQKFTYPPEITEDFETENAYPPIEVTLQVQDKVTFFEEPTVARWDAEGKYWRTDGISDVYYTPEDRVISFCLETFGPVTLMQDTHINMPYQSWELRPLDVNKVLLIVTTVLTEIQIQIQENLCMLSSIKVKDKEHSSVLEGKWMTPIPFIIALKETGLNIFPTAYSHFYVIINNKVPLVEMKAYRQMALLSSAFAFGWSKWNMLCNSTNVVFKMRERLTNELHEIPHWTLFMFNGDRAQRLKINEDSESFSEALGEGTEFHSTLFHMVKDLASKEAIERVRRSSCQLIDSVCYMLLSTRVLSYS
ncbi:dynein axonemal intermediate chain 7 [Erethizon dorsatum]